MEKIANAKKKKIDFPEGTKEKILEDNITNAMEEGFSNLSDIMKQGFSNLSEIMGQGFSNLSEIMGQGFSDLLNAINNNSSRTNFVMDNNENPNVIHSLGKSLTQSSKKNSNSNKTANSHPNYLKSEANSSGRFPRKSTIIKKNLNRSQRNEKRKKYPNLKHSKAFFPKRKKMLKNFCYICS